jgi:chromate reductase
MTSVFGFGGSLGMAWFSWALLEAEELAPEGVTFELHVRLELGMFLQFSRDPQEDPPDVVRRFKGRIRAADAVLISTPE